MCGIVGAAGIVDAQSLRAVSIMNDVQSHRGPDGSGLYCSVPNYALSPAAGVVLGHRRLAIIDLSDGGRQPMHDLLTGNVVTFNGEIYNFRELRDELATRGVVFRSASDTEVLLHGYREWGSRFVDRLRGIFAFAIWDPGRRTVLLARDHVGVKPVYWAVAAGREGKVVLFASELRAILASGMVPRKIDTNGLRSYVWNGFVYGPGSIVEGVSLLPAGTTACIDVDNPSVSPRTYWQVPVADRGTKDASEIRDALEESVRMQLVSDVPIGVFLSGGVDSSAVAALASRSMLGQDRLRTFTISFEEQEYDESRYGRAVARALGTEHSEIRVSQSMFRGELLSALRALDQPTFDALNTYFVSRAVKEAGITVALAGTGGDELFGGYRSFTEIPRARLVARATGALPEALVRGVSHIVERSVRGGRGTIRPQTRWGKVGDALATRGDLLALYQVAYALFTQSFGDELIAVGCGGGVAHGVPVARADELRALVTAARPLQSISALEISSFLGERLLRDTDCTSMAVALEVRVPLLDPLVLLKLSELDERVRFHPLGKKMLLRQVALGAIDPEFFDRPKSGFVMPFERWCREDLRQEIDETVRDAELCRTVGLSEAAVGRLWEAFQAGAKGLYWSRIWAVFVLLWWCRNHGVRL